MERIIGLLIHIVFISFLFSCRNSESVLISAESVMREYPDSALNLLRSIKNINDFDEKDKADYCLLLLQAMDKNYLLLENDSLIKIALDFYTNSEYRIKKAQCYFYKGRICYEANEYVEAARNYKLAELYSENSTDYVWLSQVYNHLGNVNFNLNLFSDALIHFKKALTFDQKHGSVMYILNDMHSIAKTFVFLNNNDSASWYFKHSFNYLSEVDSAHISEYYHDIGTFYYDIGDIFIAKRYVSRALESATDINAKSRSLSVLGNIYYAEENSDSAMFCWIESLKTSDLSIKVLTYNSLYYKAISEKNIDDLTLYAELYKQYADSIYQLTLAADVAEIQEKYDSESLRRKHLDSKLQLTYILIAFLLFILSCVCCFLLYLRHVEKQRRRLYRLISIKEQEIKFIQSDFDIVAADKDKMQQEYVKLQRKIDDAEDTLLKLKEKYKNLYANYKKEEMNRSIIHGSQLSYAIDNLIRYGCFFCFKDFGLFRYC